MYRHSLHRTYLYQYQYVALVTGPSTEWVTVPTTYQYHYTNSSNCTVTRRSYFLPSYVHWYIMAWATVYTGSGTWYQVRATTWYYQVGSTWIRYLGPYREPIGSIMRTIKTIISWYDTSIVRTTIQY